MLSIAHDQIPESFNSEKQARREKLHPLHTLHYIESSYYNWIANPKKQKHEYYSKICDSSIPSSKGCQKDSSTERSSDEG